MCEHIKRKAVLYPEKNFSICALMEYCELMHPQKKEEKIKICKLLKSCGECESLKSISEITGIRKSSVDRYLKENI